MNRPIWQKDIDFSIPMIHQLVCDELGIVPDSVRFLGEGFDNCVFLINEDFIFRIVRREAGLAFARNEMIALPLLPASLSLSVPRISKMGSYLKKWLWMAYPFLKGEPIYRIDRDFDFRDSSAKRIAVFLMQLHALDIEPVRQAGLAGDWLGHTNLAKRIPYTLEKLNKLIGMGAIESDQRHFMLVEEMRGVDVEPKTCVVHGDLKATHILFSELGPESVIDWGDVHLGHPSADLAIAYTMFSPKGRKDFFAAYGYVTPQMQLLAKFRALFHTLAVLEYSVIEKKAEIENEARMALRWIFQEG